MLGEEDFVNKFIDHLKKHEQIREIPRSRRYLNRPSLSEIFESDIIKNEHQRNKMIKEAVTRYSYSQSEISVHLGMHYSTINRLLKDEE